MPAATRRAPGALLRVMLTFPRRVRLRAAQSGLALMTMGSSCINPCEMLAEKICSCLPTDVERQACSREAKLQAGQRDLDNPQRIACQGFYAQCECRDLEEQRWAECGLSRE
ncbi:MAG: hypothetical protein AB2A00_32285 [Myxococcota bacterium]